VSALLEVRGLGVEFATPGGPLRAVRGVDFALGAGEVLGIVGESGSGKSVTAHALLRLLPPGGRVSGGTIRYAGADVGAMSPAELRRYRGGDVSLVFQEPGRSFDPIYPIGRALEETLRVHRPGLDRDGIRARSLELLREVHVPSPEERLGSFPHQMSGGLLQRVMIALALASDPSVLIADEPTTALDVTIQAQIVDLLLELRSRRGLAILFISHNLALVAGVADRLLVMYSGLVLEQGPAAAVLGSPRHPYTRALLDGLIRPGDHYTDGPLAAIAGTVPDPLDPPAGCPFVPRCALAAAACAAGLPPAAVDAGAAPGHTHRCIAGGVKASRRAG
jgi:oligopeptide/dipeptide ABC transporter ATP-binding protein